MKLLTAIISAQTAIRGAQSGRVHYLPWFTKGNHEFGAAYGYDRESERTFQSSRIAYAVRKTIDEHYATITTS